MESMFLLDGNCLILVQQTNIQNTTLVTYYDLISNKEFTSLVICFAPDPKKYH